MVFVTNILGHKFYIGNNINVYFYRGIVNLKMDKIENACSD